MMTSSRQLRPVPPAAPGRQPQPPDQDRPGAVGGAHTVDPGVAVDLDRCGRVALPALLRLVACDRLGAVLVNAHPTRDLSDVAELGLLVWDVTRHWWEVRDGILGCTDRSGAGVGGGSGQVCLLQLLESLLARARDACRRHPVVQAVDAVVAFWLAGERGPQVRAGWRIEQSLRGGDHLASVAVTVELLDRLCTDLVLAAAALASRLAGLSGLSVGASSAPLAVLHTQLATVLAPPPAGTAGE